VGERQEGHHHQQDQVQPQQHAVEPGDVPEGQMMCEPEPADHQEAQHVRHVLWSKAGERSSQVLVSDMHRQGDLDHQDGEGDGEHAVGERQDPSQALPTRLVVLADRLVAGLLARGLAHR
jgi:hypothetical protein